MSKTRFRMLVTMLVSIVFVLAACGGDDSTGGDGGGSNAKIAIGPPASETNTISKVILGAYGVEEGDFQAYQEGFGDAADLVQDGNIDISVGVLGLPAGSIESLHASAGDVVMLGISTDVIGEIEEASNYEHYVIPEDSYEFVDYVIDTITA